MWGCLPLRPVALDVACADAVTLSPDSNSQLKEHWNESGDHFHKVGPNTNWKVGIAHAVELGIGTTEYELIRV